jgi:hypothetical protein
MVPTRICLTVALLVLAVVSIVKSYAAYGEKTLDVIVNLSNTNDNIGRYLVHVTVYGKETLEQSKVIDTSSQTCPDDVDSLCYANAGTFSFASKSVPINSKIQVCVEEISLGVQNCVYAQNTEKNTPETITLGVPQVK